MAFEQLGHRACQCSAFVGERDDLISSKPSPHPIPEPRGVLLGCRRNVDFHPRLTRDVAKRQRLIGQMERQTWPHVPYPVREGGQENREVTVHSAHVLTLRRVPATSVRQPSGPNDISAR